MVSWIDGETIQEAPKSIVWSKALNRKITGSLNDFVKQAQYFIKHREMNLLELSERLNRSPMSILNYKSPATAWKDLEPKTLNES